ncbi:MAG: hypothetical protein RLZZ387_100 [Chloroflexota bacterium]|jgi:hypothetical protein
MRLQLFADLHDLTVIGVAEVSRDRFSRFYLDGVRVLVALPHGLFTALRCADGRTRYVMTADWQAAGRLPASGEPPQM